MFHDEFKVRKVKAKYGNVKTQVLGRTFASKREAHRYVELKHMQQLGVITDLKIQARFELIPKVGNERAAHYIADFTYIRDGILVVEDAKSSATRTKEYILKRKLMLYVHNIQVIEV